MHMEVLLFALFFISSLVFFIAGKDDFGRIENKLAIEVKENIENEGSIESEGKVEKEAELKSN